MRILSYTSPISSGQKWPMASDSAALGTYRVSPPHSLGGNSNEPNSSVSQITSWRYDGNINPSKGH